jgi:hypothetical protein
MKLWTVPTFEPSLPYTVVPSTLFEAMSRLIGLAVDGVAVSPGIIASKALEFVDDALDLSLKLLACALGFLSPTFVANSRVSAVPFHFASRLVGAFRLVDELAHGEAFRLLGRLLKIR